MQPGEGDQPFLGKPAQGNPALDHRWSAWLDAIEAALTLAVVPTGRATSRVGHWRRGYETDYICTGAIVGWPAGRTVQPFQPVQPVQPVLSLGASSTACCVLLINTSQNHNTCRKNHGNGCIY